MRPLYILAAVLATAQFSLAKEATIEVAGKPVLTAEVPKDAEVTVKAGKTTIAAKDLHIYIWTAEKAKTVGDAAPNAAALVKSEFTKFEGKALPDLKVLGHDAKHFTGKGEEADDNDPGTADVVIFTDGKHVFAACVHGEGDEAAKERPEFLKVLKSLKAK